MKPSRMPLLIRKQLDQAMTLLLIASRGPMPIWWQTRYNKLLTAVQHPEEVRSE